MTRYKHSVYTNVHFDAEDDSLFLIVDGDNVAMFDADDVDRLNAVLEHSTTPLSDLEEHFVELGCANYAAAAAALLFKEANADISRQVIGEEV